MFLSFKITVGKTITVEMEDMPKEEHINRCIEKSHLFRNV